MVPPPGPLVSLRGMRRSGAVGRTHLAGGVDDLGGELLAFVFDDLAEGVLNCRVVAFDKVAVDKLHRKRGLACAVASVLQSQLQACDSDRPARQRTATGAVASEPAGMCDNRAVGVGGIEVHNWDSEDLPTDRLPTIATFLDFEGAMTPMGR